uniref:hypothetical protein n=1 Tax=Nonomuraea sp. CA-251285 TaxID=3240002 RepID=UPI003F491594
MSTPAERPRLTAEEHLAVQAEAAEALMQQLLTSQQWAVAVLHIEGGHRPRIAALNVYGSLADAVASHETLTALTDHHEHVDLIPVGPITPAELLDAGLLSERGEGPDRSRGRHP